MDDRMLAAMKELKETCMAMPMCGGCPMHDNCSGSSFDDMPEDWKIVGEEKIDE